MMQEFVHTWSPQLSCRWFESNVKPPTIKVNQDLNFFRIIFHTTQPAHVITLAAVLCVTSALYPSLSIEKSSQPANQQQPKSKIASFVYLTSFVVHFGAQIWMTFVSGLTFLQLKESLYVSEWIRAIKIFFLSGLSLYFALPRHAFAEVQRVLFPRYFTINACLSLTTLVIFVKRHSADTWDGEIAIQVRDFFGIYAYMSAMRW